VQAVTATMEAAQGKAVVLLVVAVELCQRLDRLS
jgi:hypothetical protein